MANLTRENENTSLNERVPATSPSDMLSSSSSRSGFVVNIKDNSGTVVVGDNNVVNVSSPAPSSTTGLASWNKNPAKGSIPTVYSESILKYFAVRKSRHKPHHRQYVREKRKFCPGTATENPRNKMPAILALRVMLGLIHLFQLYASPIDKTILANGIV